MSAFRSKHQRERAIFDHLVNKTGTRTFWNISKIENNNEQTRIESSLPLHTIATRRGFAYKKGNALFPKKERRCLSRIL